MAQSYSHGSINMQAFRIRKNRTCPKGIKFSVDSYQQGEKVAFANGRGVKMGKHKFGAKVGDTGADRLFRTAAVYWRFYLTKKVYGFFFLPMPDAVANFQFPQLNLNTSFITMGAREGKMFLSWGILERKGLSGAINISFTFYPGDMKWNTIWARNALSNNFSPFSLLLYSRFIDSANTTLTSIGRFCFQAGMFTKWIWLTDISIWLGGKKNSNKHVFDNFWTF